MEQSVECKAEDIQVPSGDNDVSGTSIITVESTSLASVRSDDSSIDEVDDCDYMVDVDDVNGGVEDDVASNENDASGKKPPVCDVVLFSIVKEEESTEASVHVSSKNFCTSAINGTEVTDDSNQCDSSFCKITAPENAEGNSVGDEEVPSLPTEGRSDECDDRIEMASRNNTTSESGIIL